MSPINVLSKFNPLRTVFEILENLPYTFLKIIGTLLGGSGPFTPFRMVSFAVNTVVILHWQLAFSRFFRCYQLKVDKNENF